MRLLLMIGFWGCIAYGSALCVKSAAEQVSMINAATEQRCATYNSVLPGSCQMP
jgi:hypothetical protein